VIKAAACSALERDGEAYPRSLLLCLGSDAPDRLTLFGESNLMRFPLLAFFASIRTPPGLMLQGLDVARLLRANGVPVVGGFQSPLEREMLRLLLRGSQPVVTCPARRVEGMRIPRNWRSAFENRQMLIVGAATHRWRRATVRTATYRNRLAAALADRILVVHARPASRTYRTAAEALEWGKTVYCFDHPANRDLLLLGARPIGEGSGVLRGGPGTEIIEDGFTLPHGTHAVDDDGQAGAHVRDNGHP
jgi:hypothetical protein